jgi:uncharacterized protein (TIGR02118 family)
MNTLIALYRRPAGGEDAYAAFERAYAETHLPLIAKVPGLKTIRVARVRRALTPGADLALVARMAFGDSDTLREALSSPEMAAAAENLMAIGGDDLATMLVVEEAEDLIPEAFR